MRLDSSLSDGYAILRALLSDDKNRETTVADLAQSCCRQRDELQGQREGPLRGGRRVPLWDAEGGTGPGPPGSGGQAEFPEESASGPVPADG